MSAKALIDRLIVIWGSPESINDPAFIAEIERAVKGNSDALLEKAANYLIDNYRGARFPTPAQVRNAIHEVTPIENANPEGPKYPEWQPAALKRADFLIQSEMGRKAAREGWILSLHDYCRCNGDLPNHNEVRELVMQARGFDEAYAVCCRNEAGVLNDALKKLGDTFLDKREKYAAMAMGDAA